MHQITKKLIDYIFTGVWLCAVLSQHVAEADVAATILTRLEDATITYSFSRDLSKFYCLPVWGPRLAKVIETIQGFDLMRLT